MLENQSRFPCEKGLDKKPDKTNRLPKQEEDIIWECGQLNDKATKNIISTLWWQLTQRFWMWGKQEKHSMRTEDFSFRKVESEASYIVFEDRITKIKTKCPT